MADETGPREPVKGKRERKTGSREAVMAELGPTEGRSIQFPRQLYKDVAKKAIDLDTNTSALIVRFVRAGMARYGHQYSGGSDADEPLDDSADRGKFSGETIPISETVTSSGPVSGSPSPGAGEGSETARVRKRA